MSLDCTRKPCCLRFASGSDSESMNEAEGVLQEKRDDAMMADSQGAPSITNRGLRHSQLVRPSHQAQPRPQSKPLEPFVSRALEVESIIQRNEYRRARVELGLYLILDQPPEANALVFPPSTARACYDAEDSSLPDSFSHLSDRSIPPTSSLSSFFTNPRPPSMIIKPVKEWWCSRWGRRYV